MKPKIIFGIILPAIVIFLIIIFASLNLGLNIKYNFKEELTNNDIYNNGILSSKIPLGTVDIKNEFFLPARYDFPYNVVCLVDYDNALPALTAGSLSYSDSGKNYNYDQYSYLYSNYATFSTDVGLSEAKTVDIYLIPTYEFTSKTGDQLLKDYGDYDKIVLMNYNSRNYNYNPCITFDNSDFSSGKSIELQFG